MKHIACFPEQTESHAPKKLSPEPSIHPSCQIRDCEIGEWTELMANTRMVESTFGDYSYTAGDVDIMYTDVGKFCSIASHVRINPSNHPMNRVTQHHCTYRCEQFGFGPDDQTIFDWRKADRCQIGHDVWIGHAAIIMPGVNVGTGAVIGSGAVVTKDVGNYEIAVGVPARVIRKRFDEETIARLLAIAWWNWDRDKLEKHFQDLYDLPSFLEKHAPASG